MITILCALALAAPPRHTKHTTPQDDPPAANAVKILTLQKGENYSWQEDGTLLLFKDKKSVTRAFRLTNSKTAVLVRLQHFPKDIPQPEGPEKTMMFYPPDYLNPEKNRDYSREIANYLLLHEPEIPIFGIVKEGKDQEARTTLAVFKNVENKNEYMIQCQILPHRSRILIGLHQLRRGANFIDVREYYPVRLFIIAVNTRDVEKPLYLQTLTLRYRKEKTDKVLEWNQGAIQWMPTECALTVQTGRTLWKVPLSDEK